MFNRLYVVHCKRLAERRVHMENALRHLGWAAQWIVEFDPPEIGSVFRERVTGRLTPGEASVYLKHLEIYRRIVEERVPLAFVLEDDAVIPADFATTFEPYFATLPVAFDMVFFGTSSGYEVAAGPATPLFGDGNGTRSMSGYLITGGCAALLHAELARRPIAKPVDLTINDIVREKGLKTFWSVPALIDNGTETGLFAHSLGVGWRDRRWFTSVASRALTLARRAWSKLAR